MFKYIVLLAGVSASSLQQKIQVNTLNQVITELDILEKSKLNTQLEVELLDFL